MSLLGPNDFDKVKLHSQITQIVNQRFLITTIAITLWGVAAAWLFPKDTVSSSEPIGMFRYLASSLLTLTLFALFFLSHQMLQMLRLYSTYLNVTNASNWEKDWKNYRDKFFYIGYTKQNTLIFLFLGVISTALPFLLLLAYPFTYQPLAGLIICLAVGCLYCFLVWGMGWRQWSSHEADIERRWKDL